MSRMSMHLKLEDLFIRELTESEKAAIESAQIATPMIMSPDFGKIKKSGEEIQVNHAFFTHEGMCLGFDTKDGKYSTKLADEIELINPKFNWKYIAQQNESR
jgi:hypothetical protein